ncbi:MAG TPA: LytTR family DNA-binding domain-containing protein [Saprospiraceae bacterium]|mgnify:CR=1 FL=1|nr:LytTR family DNA-binding domain-containing protein [Saprospiraceae bacterium]HMQ84620.1 LytTR family DNA-binding domain-containing protein [Saprospiraceae bacterium]
MNVLIVEDELHTAKLLQEIIEESSDFKVLEIIGAVVDTVQYLMKHQSNLDLMFFDIQLTDGLSFEIFNHIDIVTPIIFCTAYDDYALNAIKNNGIDYVLKPFKDEEIHSALKKYQRLKKQLQESNRPTRFQTNTQIQRNFLAQYREKTIIIKSAEVALFFTSHDVVYLMTYKGEKYPLFKSLDYIESVCDTENFYRINRQMIIHRDAIVSFQDYFNRKLILDLYVSTEEQAIVSRLKVSAFKNWLKK